jgi:hypothetical protein
MLSAITETEFVSKVPLAERWNGGTHGSGYAEKFSIRLTPSFSISLTPLGFSITLTPLKGM